MHLGEWGTFLVVDALLVLTPGPDWAYVIAVGLGERTLVPAVAGLVAGYGALTIHVAGGPDRSDADRRDLPALARRHPRVAPGQRYRTAAAATPELERGRCRTRCRHQWSEPEGPPALRGRAAAVRRSRWELAHPDTDHAAGRNAH